jgi:uncharacterized SAM-binding protein YcdF (DUF218 family)
MLVPARSLVFQGNREFYGKSSGCVKLLYCNKNRRLTPGFCKNLFKNKYLYMMSWQLTNALSAFLVPPGLLLAVLLAGLALGRYRPRTGRGLLIAGVIGLYLLSMPLTARFLLQHWEAPPGRSDLIAATQAIIVLGGGKYPRAPEYGGDTAGSMSLVRLRYAARLHRQTGLPILVSGGNPEGGQLDEAQVMRQTLEGDFAVPVRWIENQSANTLGNARLTRQLLEKENIRRISLVTHAWHMPRARLAFESAGFEVVAAPTSHTTRPGITMLDFLPDPAALLDSSLYFHEAIGTVWYRLRLLVQA